jgi:hypothetical protein
MDQKALSINENEIDGTGGSAIFESIQRNDPLTNPRLDHMMIKYLNFGKYKVGIIEDENHRVKGISSIEVMKDFYDIDQLGEENYYWDEEAYYD